MTLAIIIFVLAVYSVLVVIRSELPAAEYNALSDLYFSTNGQEWRWSPVSDKHLLNRTFQGIPWQFETPANPCTEQWEGVRCEVVANDHHITTLDLNFHLLRGTLPDSLNNLTYLNNLLLSVNWLYGTIPSSLGSLSNLTILDLGTNNLDGTIPHSLYNITSLEILDFSNNRLTGTVAMDFFSLNKLVVLLLDFNYFSGTIPSWPSMPYLELFAVLNNPMNGKIPLSFASYSSLKALYFSGCYLTGALPPELGALSQLEVFLVDTNLFTGAIPMEYSAWTNLISFHAHLNYFSGPLTDIFKNMATLKYVDLHSAQLTGTIPNSLSDCSLLLNVLLHENFLTGTIPAMLGKYTTSLTTLQVHGNMLRGTIPSYLSTLSSLVKLYLQDNRLSGSLEGVFNHTNQIKLDNIDISNNQFTGSLPGEIFLLPKLNTFVCITSCLSGGIPAEICNNKSEAKTIILNALHSDTRCGKESWFKPKNAFGGTIPHCIWTLPQIKTMHLSGNSLEGSLPSDLTVPEGMFHLDLCHNSLTGTIPRAIQNRSWYIIDLSDNKFHGNLIDSFDRNFGVNYTFPIGVHNLSLTIKSEERELKLQINRLSGIIPRSIQRLLHVDLVSGNLFSCKLDRSDLPSADSGDDTYTCGSTAFDLPYYVWLGTLCLALVSACYLSSALSKQQQQQQQQQRELESTTTMERIFKLLVNARVYWNVSLDGAPALQFLLSFLETFVRLAFVCGGYILTVLICCSIACHIV